MTAAWTRQYDVTDPSDLGNDATDAEMAAYNVIQRRELAAHWPAGNPTIVGMEDFVSAYWLDWLRASMQTTSAAAATMGRKGGRSTSPAKVAAVRENGAKGGRPRGPKHIPAPGRASGLRGEALCGRYARYTTGDHDLIRRRAHVEDGEGFCADCLRRLAAYEKRMFQAAHASTR
jgi:hypothetical protein